MDLQYLADSFRSMACVMSAEKTDDGRSCDIRIVTGNKAFLELAEHPPHLHDSEASVRFVPNSPYERYFPKMLGFEDLCCQAAFEGKSIHTYININLRGMWFNIFFLPLGIEDGGKHYCLYLPEPLDAGEVAAASASSIGIASDVLKTCIKLRGTNDFIKTINEVISDIRGICRSEVCTLMLLDSEKGLCNIIAKSISPDCKLKTAPQFENFYDIAMAWKNMIGESDCIIIKNEKDMEYVKQVQYDWYKTLEESGVESIVVFPLRHNDQYLGFIWATDFDTSNTLRIKETLELTTFFISSETASFQMMKRLERISYTDILTGIKNGNAMNHMVEVLTAGAELLNEPYGIIFADLNGLKRVNDQNGHFAGDLLLKKASLLLQEVLSGDDIYRAGGDEFMTIVSGCDEETFNRKVQALKERAGDPDNVCFSVGSFFNSTGCDIRTAMQEADKAMYKNKEEYYAAHPERKYR